MKSVMISEDEEDFCYICGRRATEWHHIFGGANRINSTKYGLVVPLCHACHNEPPNGVHFNREVMDWLRAEGQKRFETINSHEDFMRIFGRNYL